MKAHAARNHAKLAPSSAERWMNCAGSIRMSEGIKEKSSYFADEGTAAHTLAELCLREKHDPVDFLGGHVDVNTGKVYRAEGVGDRIFTIDDEMVDAVQLYIDTVMSHIELDWDEVEFEAKLDLRHIPGMEFGTGDCVIYKPGERRLIIIDLKYGKGVPVYADNNPQELTYALGASQRFHNRGVDWIECIIVQPRSPGLGDSPPGVRKPHVIEGIDLVEFRGRLVEAAAATAAPDAPLHAGDWCKFCPAAAGCPELRAKVLETAEMEFGGDPPIVNNMTADEMAATLTQASVIKDWLKRVEERAHQMALDGSPPTGFKLVASRATRRWKDEDGTVKYLAAMLDLTDDQIYVSKVRSPAQVEKVIGAKRKSEIVDLYTSKSSGTILVPLSDPRQPFKADAEEEFA